jgi:hypothetical protein
MAFAGARADIAVTIVVRLFHVASLPDLIRQSMQSQSRLRFCMDARVKART